ncbi:hypothetical protein E4U22_008169, partial [Claviceps purpurea]
TAAKQGPGPGAQRRAAGKDLVDPYHRIVAGVQSILAANRSTVDSHLDQIITADAGQLYAISYNP